MPQRTRRQFLETTLLAAAAAVVPCPAPAAGPDTTSPNDRVTVAVLGCGIRGKQHAEALTGLDECDIAWVCDPDLTRARAVAAYIASKGRRTPRTEKDLRKVLDDKSVAAVFIATPNHWHALAAIWAMQAGKDVYVEKPVSHNITEGRRIVQTARRLGRICQGGTQNRSNQALAEAVGYMREGKLGEVSLARSVVFRPRESIGGPGHYPIPETVDYNLWAGPAPMSPLTRPQFHYDWHWFWSTGCGELGNNNIHSLDVCRWGLGVTGLGKSVLSYGGRLGYSDAGETPNTQVVIYDFGGRTIVAETRGLKSVPILAKMSEGWLFYGTKGIIAGTSLFDLDGKLVSTFSGKNESHFGNFLQAVRSRKTSDLHAEILEGHQSTALCHTGNISYRLGGPASPEAISQTLAQLKVHDNVAETFDRTLKHLADNKVDPANARLTLGRLLRPDSMEERFVDCAEANALLTRDYRAAFVVPRERDVL